MRMIATGDLHAHAWKQFSYTRLDGMNSRLYNSLLVLDRINEEAIKRGITRVLLNGDILEDSDYIDVTTYDALYEKLENLHEAKLDVVINRGNHDVTSNQGSKIIHTLRPFRKVARIIEEPDYVFGNRLCVIPWMPLDNLKNIIKKMSSTFVLALHCGVQGATTGPNDYLVNNPIKLQDIRYKDFKLILLSDYHQTQWLRKNVFYMGSPLQHNFGETHEPCIWDVGLGKGEKPPEAIPTNLPKFRKIAFSNMVDIKNSFRWHPGDYFRVTLPEGSKVHPSDIEAAAQKYSCQVQIRHEADEKNAVEEVSEQVEMLSVLRSYVDSQISKANKRKRLYKLGRKLFERS